MRIFENQVQQYFGYCIPAICYSPDEKSGAATIVGFRWYGQWNNSGLQSA
ncbi:hypothetical protein [Pedobacter psychrodurus]|nr:hypothetical protein [Pedobacter psychrodurus]